MGKSNIKICLKAVSAITKGLNLIIFPIIPGIVSTGSIKLEAINIKILKDAVNIK